jgi:hypothetical protein
MNSKDRTADGKFAPGNGGGPGNPHSRATARLRVLLLETVTEDDFREIVRALVKRAKDGQLAAIHEVLTRLLGKPAEVPNPDTLDIEELRQKTERDGAALVAALSGGGKTG